MTGTITKLYSCPRCMMDMSDEKKPEKCPQCDYHFYDHGEGMSKKFVWHKSPYRQLYEMVQQDVDRLKGKGVKEMTPNIPKGMDPDDALRLQTLQGAVQNKRKLEMQEFFVNTSPQQVEDWFKSMMHLFQTAHYSPDKDAQLLRMCVLWGKKMGKYAETMEGMLRQGALFYERPVSPKL